MAYTDTALRLQFAKASDYIQANETRGELTGILDVGLMNQSSLIGATQVARLKQSVNQPTKVYLLSALTGATGTSRVCEGAGDTGSRAIDISFSTIEKGFKISRDEIAENEFSLSEVFAHNFSEAVRLLDEAVDAAGDTFLNAGISDGTATAPYTPLAGVIDVPLADYEYSASNQFAPFLSKLRAQMAKDNYRGDLQIIGEPLMEDYMARVIAQGESNANNNVFQARNYSFGISNNVQAPGVGENMIGYIMPKGHYSLVTWAKRYGADDNIGTDVWMNVPHPTRAGIMLEVKVKHQCEDTSGTTGGATNDRTMAISVSYDYAYVNGGSGLTDTGIRRLDFQTT